MAILEIAILKIKPGRNREFEMAFAEASKIISAMPGYLSVHFLLTFTN